MGKSFLRGKSVLVTGGTGSIGSQLVREAIQHDPARVLVFSRDDSKHFYFQQELRKHPNVRFMIGDIRDPTSLARAFEPGVDVVLHAAALKHVTICEQNPTEAVKTNILGTQNIVDLAARNRVETMITVSTDKAVNPTCTMGATKYIAEKLTFSANREGQPRPAFACVRFGNVLGTRGSVIPAFYKAIKDHGTMYVSDPNVTRFAITIEDAAELVLKAAAMARGGEIFVLKMSAFQLGDLVQEFQSMKLARRPPKVQVLGLAPGEKLHEELVTTDETPRLYEDERFYLILPNGGAADRKDVRKTKLAAYRSDMAPRIPRQDLRRHIEAAIQPFSE